MSAPQDEDEVAGGEAPTFFVRPSDNIYSYFMFISPTESKKHHGCTWDIVMAYILVGLNFFMQAVLVWMVYEAIVSANVSWQNGIMQLKGHQLFATKSVLIDDEPMDLMAISELIKGYKDLEVIGKFQNSIEAKKFVDSNKVDLIILDVEMPELNGLNFIKSIENVEHIILISSNSNYAAESYDYSVTDYIVKPLSKERFSSAISKVKEVSESIKTSSDRDFAFVKDGTKIVRIDFNEILFIEALADYVQINTVDDRYTVLATMKSMQANLPQNDFFRVHRSYIVRKDKIKIIEDNMILMDKKNIPISRSAKQEFFNTFNFL
jgi:DNA-binding LytR/AlgR family response regulator